MKLRLPFFAVILISLISVGCRTRPQEPPAKPVVKKPVETVMISIAGDGNITLGARLTVTVEDLVPKMKASGVDKSCQIIIKADQKAQGGVLIKVLDKLAEGQFTKVNIVTTEVKK